MSDALQIIGLILCFVAYIIFTPFESDNRYKTGYKHNYAPTDTHWIVSIICWILGILFVFLGVILDG